MLKYYLSHQINPDNCVSKINILKILLACHKELLAAPSLINLSSVFMNLKSNEQIHVQ